MFANLRVDETAPTDWKYISEGGSTIVFSYTGPSHPKYDGTALRLRKAPLPGNEDAYVQEKPIYAGEPEPEVEVPELEPDPEATAAWHKQHAELREASAAERARRYAQSREENARAVVEPADNDWYAGEEEEGRAADDEPDDPTVQFQRAVIARLIPAEFLPRLESVRVKREWLEELATLVEPLRPLERRAKDRIDTERRKAVLATDLVGGEGWAVEIKPKWGFLPNPTWLSPETRDIKRRTCRFCMHAHLKSTQGEDVALGYCPLDLFSGNEGRMRKALGALWDVWVGSGGAVNNLRVFVNGKMLKPSLEDPKWFVPLAAQLFPSSDPTPPESRTLDELRTAFVRTLHPPLWQPVLARLSRLQRRLDALDVEGLAALWARVHGPGTPFGTGPGAREPDMGDWLRFVHAYFARESRAEDDAAAGVVRAPEELAPPTEEELAYRVVAFLLAAAFKDCSVMVRFRPEGEADGAVRFETTVTVIDLDVKSVDRLAKWAQQDREIVEAYRGVPEPRVCVDDGPMHPSMM
ncbi:hypothetical protein OH77DRAFT_57725 [Trametes cingulata]|nr:hypothetical protein OH77DRAFT_57725 [Trametes cingulata]